jgi:hypothetical protein
MQSINWLRCFETCEKSSLKTDSFTTSWRQWSKSSIIDWKIQKESAKESDVDERWLSKNSKKSFHVVAFTDRNENRCHHVVVARCAFRREEKSKDNFRCFLFFEDCDFRREEEKSKDNSRCFLLFGNCDFRREEEKSKSNLRCSLLLDDAVVDWKKKKSKSNFCWFLSRSSFVVVVTVIVIYQFWVATRHAIISIAFVINFQKYCDNVRRADEKRRQSFKNSSEKEIFDKITSWNSFFDLVRVEIVIRRISFAKKN